MDNAVKVAFLQAPARHSCDGLDALPLGRDGEGPCDVDARVTAHLGRMGALREWFEQQPESIRYVGLPALFILSG
jgi:hypothetical protein